MPTDTVNFVQLDHLLRTSTTLGSLVNKIWQYDAHTLVVSFNIAGNAASIDLAFDNGEVACSVLGRDAQLKRHLRNALVGKARLVIDSTERHTLGTWPVTDARGIVQGVVDWTCWLKNQAETAPTEYGPNHSMPEDHIGVFWWDNRSNFGDAVGPWLVERLTGRTPVNSRRVKHEGRSLATVGSIIGHLDRDHVDLWGTGLMGPLDDARLKRLKTYGDVKVHAVRGRQTAYELRNKLGWHVPDIYGDPALLLPRFYTPRRSAPASGAVAVVPHYAHAKYFPPATNDTATHTVDVAQGLEQVIDEISSARSCISTSLHGIIIAQAYGVPWIWLRIDDHQLGGDQYKFDDFFSTLAPGPVPRVDVAKHQVSRLDFNQLAKSALLPELNTSLDDLLAAFPRAQAASGRGPWTPPHVNVMSAGSKDRKTLMSKFARLKRLIVEPRKVVLVDPKNSNAPVALPSSADRTDAAALDKTLKAILRELQTQRRSLETIRISATAGVVASVRSFVNESQLDLTKTLETLADSEQSFARFGDGEFRLLLRPDFDLRFQQNGPELREAMGKVLSNSQDNLLVGFPQLYRDAHWTGIWAELWSELQPYLDPDTCYGNSHVTRPLAFSSLGPRATQLWRKIWDGKHVAIVTGEGSRFDLLPELFSNVAKTTTFASSATNAFSDLERVKSEVLASDVDLVLIALGPAGTILAAELAAAGRRSLDIGHLSDSYANVVSGAPRPESKPLRRP